ncbi:MAG: hypothetical protein K2N85_07400 [Lachnospiraceae bacterium]|nr:hypothetical protein [Lachnospiraceae bacterium]
MVQYEMYFPSEYLEEILNDLAGIMKLNIEKRAIEAAMQERNFSSLNNLLILRKDENIICVDCNDRDVIFPLVVICQEKYADAVNERMLNWDNICRREYDQELTDNIPNVYGKEKTLLYSTKNIMGKNLFDEWTINAAKLIDEISKISIYASIKNI